LLKLLLIRSRFEPVRFMSSYAVVEDTNAYRTTNAPKGLLDALSSFNSDKKRIKCVAIGPSGSYFVCTTGGAARWAHDRDDFSSKLKQIDCSKVKQVSFGPNGTFAIVMDHGFCHHCTQNTDNNGPWHKIEEWQNNIQSVAMTNNSKEWIVVNKNDGFSSYGLQDNMLTFLRGVIAGSKSAAVEIVTLGSGPGSWLVQSRAGTYRYLLSNSSTHKSFKSRTSGSRLRSFW